MEDNQNRYLLCIAEYERVTEPVWYVCRKGHILADAMIDYTRFSAETTFSGRYITLTDLQEARVICQCIRKKDACIHGV